MSYPAFTLITWGQAVAQEKITDAESTPVPVRIDPQPNPFVNVPAYTLQGFILILAYQLSAPLFEIIKTLLSERVRERKSKENQALDSQINQQKILQQQTDFLQKLITKQQEENSKIIKEALENIHQEFSSIDDSVKYQGEIYREILEQIKAAVQNNQPIKISIENEVPVVISADNKQNK